MKYAKTGAILILLTAITSPATSQAPKTARVPESRDASCPPPGTGPGHSTAFDPCKYLRVPRPGFPTPKSRFAPDPAYPELAREGRISGVVALAVAINEKGTVDAVRLEYSLGPEFDQNAMAAVRRWEFVPTMKDGHAVAVQMHMEITFKPL
jgi:periplasmic protein TonB